MKNNKQKTDWELLPEMYRELVPKKGVYHMKKGSSLGWSFFWADTVMGFSFWETVSSEIAYLRVCS